MRRVLIAAALALAACSSGGGAHDALSGTSQASRIPPAAPTGAPARTRLAVEGTVPTTTALPSTSTRVPVSARASRSRPAPRPVTPSGAGAPASTGSVWDALAKCESGGRWNANTGNGYFGGLQENMGFWTTYDGLAFAARPDLASRDQQITVAERARDGYTNRKGEHFKARGYTPWPHCGRRFR